MDAVADGKRGLIHAQTFTSSDVIAELERLFEERGVPEFIRTDNGTLCKPR